MRTYLCTMCVFLMILLTACGGRQAQTPASKGFGDEPEWALNVPDGCGLGVVEYRGNRSLARNAANARARDDLARQLETIVQGMISDYAAQGEVDGESFTEERIVQVSRQIVDQTLSGTVTVATHLIEGDSPQLYSLVCMKPEIFGESLAAMQLLSERQRRQLQERAQIEFEELNNVLRERKEGIQ